MSIDRIQEILSWPTVLAIGLAAASLTIGYWSLSLGKGIATLGKGVFHFIRHVMLTLSKRGDAPHPVFRRWLALFYLFESLIVLGAIASSAPAARSFGLICLGVTLALHVASGYFPAVSQLNEGWRSKPRGLLIDMLMPPDRAEDVINNLLGRYEYWVKTHGANWAKLIFWLQSIGSIMSFWTDWMLKRIKLLKTLVSN